MEVLGRIGIVVFYSNIIPVAFGIGGFDHISTGGCQNGGSYRGGKISSFVGSDAVAVIGNSSF